jgi:hypothetical protein
MATKATAEPNTEVITIAAPRFKTLNIRIVGSSPLMQLAFSEKARNLMMDKMAAGQSARGKKVREARDFDEDMRQAQHRSDEGWAGLPAPAFRNACIDACRMVGFKMTHARMSIFVEADGFDKVDGTPLVRLDAGEPEQTAMAVRNATGVADIRIRPMWRKWAVDLRVRFDEDQFTATDVINLLTRAGMQVGVGEGRPFSKQSNGLGYGMFTVENVKGT